MVSVWQGNEHRRPRAEVCRRHGPSSVPTDGYVCVVSLGPNQCAGAVMASGSMIAGVLLLVFGVSFVILFASTILAACWLIVDLWREGSRIKQANARMRNG